MLPCDAPSALQKNMPDNGNHQNPSFEKTVFFCVGDYKQAEYGFGQQGLIWYVFRHHRQPKHRVSQFYKTLYGDKYRVRKIIVNWCKRHK